MSYYTILPLRTTFRMAFLFLLALPIFTLAGCKKEEEPFEEIIPVEEDTNAYNWKKRRLAVVNSYTREPLADLPIKVLAYDANSKFIGSVDTLRTDEKGLLVMDLTHFTDLKKYRFEVKNKDYHFDDDLSFYSEGYSAVLIELWPYYNFKVIVTDDTVNHHFNYLEFSHSPADNPFMVYAKFSPSSNQKSPLEFRSPMSSNGFYARVKYGYTGGAASIVDNIILSDLHPTDTTVINLVY